MRRQCNGAKRLTEAADQRKLVVEEHSVRC